MRQFLIIFDDIPIDWDSVKAGSNSTHVITACRCINVGLFISKDLRRDVIVSIAIGQPLDMRILSFPGDRLRRVSPDERSISFFLLKAIEISRELPLESSKVMDNGIVVYRTKFDDYLKLSNHDDVTIADSNELILTSLNLKSADSLFIYDNRVSHKLLESFRLDNYNTILRPPHPERFILDINREIDRVSDDT